MCVRHAEVVVNEALATLAWAAPGTVIDGEVDGDAYRLTAE